MAVTVHIRVNDIVLRIQLSAPTSSLSLPGKFLVRDGVATGGGVAPITRGYPGISF